MPQLPTIEQQDYENFFKKQTYLIAKLFAYFMEHPIIFIGYSLGDENIKSILYNVTQIIDTKGQWLIISGTLTGVGRS